jgi:hypothetical protein
LWFRYQDDCGLIGWVLHLGHRCWEFRHNFVFLWWVWSVFPGYLFRLVLV